MISDHQANNENIQEDKKKKMFSKQNDNIAIKTADQKKNNFGHSQK